MAISLLSLLPAKSIESSYLFDIPYIDKLAHFFMYTVLSAILLRDISFYRARSGTLVHILITAGFVIIYGGVIEYIQLRLITSREGDLLDFLFNIAGCLFGIILYRVYFTRKMSRQG
jgi:VanZ family protein